MRKLVIALGLAAAVAVGTAAHAQEGDVMKYCKPDVERLCKGIQPGGGRLIQCLKMHEKEMSVGCAQALQKMKG